MVSHGFKVVQEFHATHAVDGRNPLRTTWKPWQTIVCWYLQGNHQSRVRRRCETSTASMLQPGRLRPPKMQNSIARRLLGDHLQAVQPLSHKIRYPCLKLGADVVSWYLVHSGPLCESLASCEKCKGSALHVSYESFLPHDLLASAQ